MSLMSLQGPINLAPRITSTAKAKPGALRFVGQADVCDVEMEAESASQTDSYTGQRLEIGSLSLGKTSTISLTLKDWSLENLALALYGQVFKVEAGTISGEALPAGLIVGDRVRLDNPFVSDVLLTASDGATALVPGTDYRVDSATAGIIELLSESALTATAAYSYAPTEQLGLFTTTPPERWLLLDGINTENDERVIVQFYRVKFQPVSSLSLLHNEGYGELPLTGNVLADTTQGSDSELGYFGSYVQKVAE
ncbi:hypothetical protein VSX61_08825 [Brenneria populi subsp. brevivirga]|uniref:phage tail tube protein n=1 Tax=Brenneria populi TaxID=1505588 RepID=UPI002E1868F0|nr:hypothetical protein [Brenneria populi subsp. brevivirga]